MANSQRGFASMSPEKQREIASAGGRAAHASGNAHEFTSEEAREAGRKGGLARHRSANGSNRTPAAPHRQTAPPVNETLDEDNQGKMTQEPSRTQDDQPEARDMNDATTLEKRDDGMSRPIPASHSEPGTGRAADVEEQQPLRNDRDDEDLDQRSRHSSHRDISEVDDADRAPARSHAARTEPADTGRHHIDE